MNENGGKKRREWVKNAAIIFLSVMLVLTFFSNTFMNYSLPEVAAQYVQSGTITAKIRGTGTVESGDPYNVKINETRTISSVLVKTGDKVVKGDPLFLLEDKESKELKDAQAALDAFHEDNNCYTIEDVDGDTVTDPQGILYMTANSASGSKYYELLSTQQDYVAAKANYYVAQPQINPETVTVSGPKSLVSQVKDETPKGVSKNIYLKEFRRNSLLNF